MKGLFVAIEGNDGSGKSTFTSKFKKELEELNIPSVFTREPGGTKISEKIRTIILDNDNKEMDPRTEALLYAAARAQHVNELIIPALNSGKLVISERFVLSSIAYQGYGRELGEEQIRLINSFATDGVKPDITIFLKADSLETLKRVGAKRDRIENEENEFHQRVENGYNIVIKNNKDNIIVVDAKKSIDEVYEEVKNHIFSAWKGLRK